MQRQGQPASIRLAEVVAALSLATDLGTGYVQEHGLRTCLLSLELAEGLGLSAAERAEVYYLALLRYAGCSADAHFTVATLGDEIAIGKYFATADSNSMGEILGIMLRHVGEELPPLRRIQMVLNSFAAGMRSGPQVQAEHHRAHCEAAQITASRLGFDSAIQRALGQVFEQWGGKGKPNGLQGEEIASSVRIVQLAENIYDFYRLGGERAAVDMARQRSGTIHDPTIVAYFCDRAPHILACLELEPAWDAVLEHEPGEWQLLDKANLDTAARAIADFADLKSFYTVGHSSGVANLAAAAALRCRLPEEDVANLRCAALVHDLGRVGISLRIWDKPGPLTPGEWEKVRLHPYYAERVLARSASLAPLGALAALHHERLDGSGYHRNLPGTMLPLAARILAAADAYHAMIEPRAYRPARSPDEAAHELQGEVATGRLDAEAVGAVLNAAGHRVRSTRRSYPGGLSDREVEVLRLIARGLANQEMARILAISKVTVGRHIQNIYDKIGVSTRASATLFAMQHDLIIDSLDARPPERHAR